MTEPTDLQDDPALAALYRSDRAEPDAALDARILAVARADTSARKPRSWRFVAGVGAALSATVALALLVPVLLDTRQTSRPVLEAPASKVALPTAPALEASSDVIASQETPSERRTVDASARLVREIATHGMAATAPARSEDSAPPLRPRAALALRTLADAARQCVGGGESLEVDGAQLCVFEGSIEVRDVVPGECATPLTLARDSGEVVARRIDQGLDIAVDGVSRFRIRCENGAWQVDASPAAEGG
jgi:hypothetical protein